MRLDTPPSLAKEPSGVELLRDFFASDNTALTGSGEGLHCTREPFVAGNSRRLRSWGWAQHLSTQRRLRLTGSGVPISRGDDDTTRAWFADLTEVQIQPLWRF
jgi:hypothetical protein